MIKFDENEKIIFAVRKHWFILFAETVFLVFMVVAPFVAHVIFAESGLSVFFAEIFGNTTALSVAFTSIWFLIVWIIFFVVWTDYYLDILILTDKRIIDIEQRGLFSREVSTFRLDRIQDITVDIHGIIPTLLGFGDIHVQTAGDDREFIGKGMPHPSKLRDKILKEHALFMENRTSSGI